MVNGGISATGIANGHTITKRNLLSIRKLNTKISENLCYDSDMKTLQTLKGFRDFLPEVARKRQYVINTLKSVFELYGFEPLETPSLEYEEILLGKYGDEGDKLMYRFKDNGDRNVALRYDQTVPLARVVAQYQNDLPFPFKRYQMQPVWRAENTQRGRFREFLQCDIDTVGTKNTIADAEIIALVEKAFTTLGFKRIKILLNDRANFKNLPPRAITIIDKLKKIGSENVKKELRENGFDETFLDSLLTTAQTPYLQDVILQAKEFGVTNETLMYEPTLARGLDYYTGVIIEVEIDGYTVGSVGGGGRYDELVGMFANRDFPAVGFAFGFDRIIEAMTEQDMFPFSVVTSTTKVLVTVFNKELEIQSLSALTKIRSIGIPSEMYSSINPQMDKQLKYAAQKNIPYVIIIGPDEVIKKVVSLRNVQTKEVKQVSLDHLSDEII